MTHLSEATFHNRVRQWFENQYGERAVKSEVYQPGPRWYVDLVVTLPSHTLYIEIENDAASVRDGVGQCIGYAGADPHGVPVLITPPGHLNTTRAGRLQSGSPVIIREFDAEAGEFV